MRHKTQKKNGVRKMLIAKIVSIFENLILPNADYQLDLNRISQIASQFYDYI